MVALGGADRAGSNLARIEILGGAFSGNADADVAAFGYYDPGVGLPIGADNHLELRIAGAPGIDVVTASSVPDDGADTNSVVVLPPNGGSGPRR